MRAFLLAPIAFIVAVSAGHLEQRSPFHAISSTLVARAQVIDPDIIPAECKTACSATVSDLNGCASIECLCTNDNAKQLGQCVDCLVNVGGSDASGTTGQATMDGFVDGCKASGINIDSLDTGDESSSDSDSSSSSKSSSSSSPKPSSSPSSSSNSNSNPNSLNDVGAAMHLVTNGGVLAAALIGVVAYLC